MGTYPCSFEMNFSVSDAVHLDPWMEARGPLAELKEENGRLIAKIGPVTVTLPIELSQKLEAHIGQKIAILRTDADYRCRFLDEEVRDAT
ncbi:MAG: hypothetical protein A4E48_01750 [Methanosaeta sp. PtaU1.Bin060]|nr:MAG: hypothetical protein A4E48_01750 [Methanosaeta sp. PtaU1.Bin060]